MLRIVATLLVLWMFLLAASVDKRASTPVPPTNPLTPTTEEARAANIERQIAVLDQQLFEAVFESCDLARLQSMLAADFEFIHDKGGLVATNAAQFVQRVRKSCEAKSDGKEDLSGRELLSSEIYPMAEYGAVQTGTHRFAIMKAGEPERAGDIAKFTHVWRRTAEGWQIARVLSYDHRPSCERKGD